MSTLMNIASYWNMCLIVGVIGYAIALVIGILGSFSVICDSIIGTIISIVLSPIAIVSGLVGYYALEMGVFLLLMDIVLKIIN